MSCSRSLRSLARSQPQDSNFKLFPKIRKFPVTRSIIRNSGLLWENFSRWLNSETPSSTLSKSFQDPSSTRKTKTSKSHSLPQVFQSDQRLRLCHGASASSQDSGRHISGSDCQLFRFRLGRVSKITEVNKCLIGFSIQCQSSVNQQNSSFNCSFIRGYRALCNDSSSSRIIGNQELHSGCQLSHLVISSQHCHSDRFISSKINDFKVGNFMSFKAHRVQVSSDSARSQRGLELKKVGTHFNPSDVLTKYVPVSVLGQRLPRWNIFKVNSKRSAAKQVQYSTHPQPPSTSLSMPATFHERNSHTSSSRERKSRRSRGSWQHRVSAIGSFSMMQSSSCINSIMCFRFLVSRIQVTNSSGNSISVWKTQYIT